MAAPKLPVPSIMPVTVPKAFSLLDSYFYLPRSVQEVADTIPTAPPTVMPRTNITTENSALF